MTPRAYGQRGELPAGRMHGMVKSFDLERGWGWISPSGGGGDVFLHVSDFEGSGPIGRGDVVEFELARVDQRSSEKWRPRAKRVVRIGEA